ncbi:sarcosine oxidase subunit gamma [Leucothrix pacifica]|uniref:Sarcosine oxidase subunit gamma n=2 Tax=Leucothrix pacifica TaxID=1247513 RepID=A0A317C3P9_9GAMM|nr:sarcosine oxidase subunit gamma [Leucothrix pacifica]
MQTVQMNLIPNDVSVRAETPLHHVDLATIATQGAQDRNIKIQELALLDHLVLRGHADNAALTTGIQSVMGVSLPINLQSVEKEGQVIRWISPDEWLITTPHGTGFALEQQLRNAISTHCAVVNVSGGQTVITVEGAGTEEMLRKCTPYDIHISNMPVGKVVTSLFGKAQAVIRRTGEQQFEVVIRRSFSDYCWLWLQDSCREFGFTVKL